MNNDSRIVAMVAVDLLRKRMSDTKESIRICDDNCDCDDRLCGYCDRIASDWLDLEEDGVRLRRLLATFPECRTNEKPLSKREMQDIIEDLLRN